MAPPPAFPVLLKLSWARPYLFFSCSKLFINCSFLAGVPGEYSGQEPYRNLALGPVDGRGRTLGDVTSFNLHVSGNSHPPF